MNKYGMTLVVLTTGLSEAAQQDGGLQGENISEWLRKTAETLSGEKRPAARAEGVLFCGRDGWQEKAIDCEHFCPAGGACHNTNDCDDQIPF